MSETTTSSSEPVTGPVTAATPAATAYQEPRRRSRVTAVAAWVGIVAGVVFIVAVIFFSGFILGKSSGGHHRGGGGPHGDRDFAVIHRGPPPMFPMWPRGDERPPFGPGSGPQAPQSPDSSPDAPTTTAPARP
ncbi:hypothetical protein [Mycobacterium deserti]